MKKINLKTLYLVTFPVAFLLILHFVFNYLPSNIKDYALLLIGIGLGIGSVFWWQGAKHFLFATKIKIISENQEEK